MIKRKIEVFKEDQENSRQKYEKEMIKHDRLRQKYDLRNKDPKQINDIYLRWRIQELDKRTESMNKEKLIKKILAAIA